MLKKIFSSALALSTYAVFAGTMGDVSSGSQWQIGGHALYLEALLGNYSYTVNYTQDIASEYIGRDNIVYSPQWGWGFDLEASYLFNQQNDVKASWAHYGHQNNYTYGRQYVVAADTPSIARTVHSTMSPNWNWVNVEFGQSLQFNEHSKTRLFAGVEYTRIAFSKLVDIVMIDDTFRTINQALSFNGFGPRVGLDLTYSFFKSFGIYGVSGFGLPIGNQSFNNTINTTSLSIYHHIANTGAVPEIDFKLGAQYHHALSQGTLTADVGWMWINYFNSTLYSQPLSSTLRTPQYANFSLTGLYFGLKWNGNMLG